MKIFVAAHYNLNNGDRAVLEATLQVLTSQIPKAEIIVSAFDPTKIEDERISKCVGWPIINSSMISKVYQLLGRHLNPILVGKILLPLIDKEYKNELKSSDLVLISGGHHFTDILGESTYLRLLSNLIYPIAFNKNTVLLPQTIGPTNNKRITRINVEVLNKVRYIAYRDNTSKLYLSNNKVQTNSAYIPDIVYCLSNASTYKKERNSRLQIGVALYCNYPEEKQELFNNVKRVLINTIETAIVELNAEINIIPMEIKGSKADDRKFASSIIEQVRTGIQSHIRIVDTDNNIMSTVSQFGMNDVILAFKTHSVVFSAISSVPLVAIAYHPKSLEFMEEMGLGEFAINDYEISSDRLMSLLRKALKESELIREKEETAVFNNVNQIHSFVNSMLNEGV